MVMAMTFFKSKNKCVQKLNEKERETLSYIFKKAIGEKIDDTESLTKNMNTFNAVEVVNHTVDLVMQTIVSRSSREHIHWAPTQSGKSAFKALKIFAFLTMNIPVIVLTKGKGESIELEGKISSYLKGSGLESRILSVYEKEQHCRRMFMNDKEACALIIPDTVQRIEIAHDLLTYGMKKARNKGRRCAGCALILDEVDAVIDRSENQDEKNEKALKKLRKHLKPYVVKVTATPIPVLANSLDNQPILTTSNEVIKNYVGVKEMKLFADLDKDSLNEGFGSDVDKFTPKNVCTEKKLCLKAAIFPGKGKRADKQVDKKKFPNVWNKKNPKVPKFNSQCMKLLRRDFDKKSGKGLLVLVDTCPWVDAIKNECIFHQASGTQDYFFKMGKKFIAIVVHADHVYYRLPGHSYGFECKSSLVDLIDEIDSKKEWGLSIPIVIFGYYAMKRSRSFRSSKRVPSAMILSLGDGQSNENCRQAAGRMTFKGRDVLLRNRKTSNVLILCPLEDFKVVKQYDPLVLEIIDLYRQGKSWKEIYWKLARTSTNFFLGSSKRKTGNYIPGQSKKGRNRRSVSNRTITSSIVRKTNPICDVHGDSMTSTCSGDESSVEAECTDSPTSSEAELSLWKENNTSEVGNTSKEKAVPNVITQKPMVTSNEKAGSLLKETPSRTPVPDMEESSLSETSTPDTEKPSRCKLTTNQRISSILQICTASLKKRKVLAKLTDTKADEEKPVGNKLRREIDDAGSSSSSSDHLDRITPKAEVIVSDEAVGSATEERPKKKPKIIDLDDGDDDYAIDLADGEEEEDPIDLTDS